MKKTTTTIKMREINENEIEVDIPTISIILDLIGIICVVMAIAVDIPTISIILDLIGIICVVMAIAGGIHLIIDMLRQIL